MPRFFARVEKSNFLSPKPDLAPDELGVWHLPSGAWLVVNMKADWNPVQWSTAFWMSPQKVAQLGARKP